MKIDSSKVIVTASKEEISEFLKDANNLLHLLPQDKINEFKSSVEECSFKVQGGITISLIQDGQEGTDKLFLKSGKFSPFPFRLTIFLTDVEGGTEGYINFDGQVSPFLKMMVEKPLSNLFNYMTQKLHEHFTK
ncbi:MAG: hypothetical protein QNK23_09045 [Crocinitomicaceae bacterium]|nr:hypothetical protein [Crocinitomicaceae bacterium]